MKSSTGRLMQQLTTDEIISLKLMQLNLHQMLAHSFTVEQILHDLQQKQESDYIFGKRFIAESTMDIQEALFKISFHLNAITKGKHIDLYSKLDELKRTITSLFDTASSDQVNSSGKDVAFSDDDETSLLLNRAIDRAARISIPDTDIMETNLSETTTAHDVLIYCFKLLFDAVHNRLMGLASETNSALAGTERVTTVPISYLGVNGGSLQGKDPPGTPVAVNASQNIAAEMLTAGREEAIRSDLNSSRQKPTEFYGLTKGVLLYSKDTVTLYHVSPRFRTVVAANVYDAVAGNYIHLLLAPCARHQSTAYVNLMVDRLLYWLDLTVFHSHETTLAGIKNMTRNEMQNHLNMVGKMLSFITSPEISPGDDAEVRRDIDVFLEQVV